MAGVGKLIKQAQKMQRKMEALQEELANREIEVSSGGGAVMVKVTLAQEIRSISINSELLKEEKSLIEESLTEAVKEALAKSRELSGAEMEQITGGMDFPGLL